MLKKFIIIIIFNLPIFVYANNIEKNTKIIGKASFYYFIWHVYDISLYANNKFSFDDSFILRLDYKRKLYGKEIANRSIKEIKNLGFFDKQKLKSWHEKMIEIFPDVTDGIFLTGIYKPNDATIFFKNNIEIGKIEDPEFGKWFFGIWLNENTSRPSLRKKILSIK